MRKALAYILAVVVAIAVDFFAGFWVHWIWATAIGAVIGGALYLLLRWGGIRKAIIVVLTMGAVAPLAWRAYSGDLHFGSMTSPNLRPHFRMGVYGCDDAWLSYGVFTPPMGAGVWSNCSTLFGLSYCSYTTRALPPSVDGWRIIVPVWFPSIVCLCYPGTCLIRPLRRYRRYRRRRLGLCLECGYDLTGNVSGVCPECGTSVTGWTADTGSIPRS